MKIISRIADENESDEREIKGSFDANQNFRRLLHERVRGENSEKNYAWAFPENLTSTAQFQDEIGGLFSWLNWLTMNT